MSGITTPPTPNPNPNPAPAEGTPPPIVTPPPSPPVPAPAPATVSAEEYARIQREHADYAKRLAEFEKEKKVREEADLSEKEKLERRLVEQEKRQAELEQQLRSKEIQILAGKLGIVDPEAAEKLIDWTKVESTESAREAALKDLLKNKTYLAGTPGSGPTQPTNPGRQGGLTVDEIKRMTPDEVNKNWDAVQAALKR